jgi:hypothetical protein
MLILNLTFGRLGLTFLSKTKEKVIETLVQTPKEILQCAVTTFIEELTPEQCKRQQREEEGHGGNSSSDDDSWLNPEENDPFSCPNITRTQEEFVEQFVDECKPLEETLGERTSFLTKIQMSTPVEDVDCVAINVLGSADAEAIIENIDFDPSAAELAKNCIHTCFLCCCEKLQQVSPIIAKAALELLEAE